MVSLKIDDVSIDIQKGVEWVIDGGEEFNLGIIKVINSTKREAYPDYADVVLTVNSKDYEACIQKDLSVRTSPGIYNHDVVLAESVIKLSQYITADRIFSTLDGGVITYEDQLDNILLTLELNKTSPLTVATATRTLLDTNAVRKEYTGGDLLTTLMDMFRGVKAVPTLSLDNVIGHELFGSRGSLISFSDIIGETITSDISDYGLAVHSKLKNATYEDDLDIGTTYFPAKGYGVVPRSAADKYSDDDAQYFLDSGIRRIPVAKILNLSDSGTGSIEADISDWIVSKAEWDDLEKEKDLTTLHTGKYKNNTFYYVEGDNIIQNVGTKYLNGGALITGDDVMEHLIKSFWIDFTGTTTRYSSQGIYTVEIEFLYQPIRDIEVRVERHNIDRVYKNATLTSNQKDSILELNRNGIALKSLINRVGNDTYEITLTYNNFTPFELFKLFDYTSDRYKIIKIQLLTRDNSVDVIYKITKNQSILNPLTAVNRAVSPFTITKRNVLSCFVVNSYVEFGGTSRTDNGGLTTLGKKVFLNNLNYSATYNTPVYNGQYQRFGTTPYLNMSVSKFPQGTTLVFNVQFQHPKVAGYQLAGDTIGKKLRPVTYTDAFGQVYKFFMSFDNGGVVVPENHPVGVVNVDQIIGGITYEVRLNPDEILGVSHIIHPITDRPNLIIHNYFSENNSMMKELSSPGKTLYYYNATTQFNIYDDDKLSGHIGTGSYSIDAGYNVITVSGVPAGSTWLIADTTNGRTYLSYSYQDEDMNTVYINDLEDRPNIEVL